MPIDMHKTFLSVDDIPIGSVWESDDLTLPKLVVRSTKQVGMGAHDVYVQHVCGTQPIDTFEKVNVYKMQYHYKQTAEHV